ncbi:dihydrodipicolinate synthase [compost metagenome]
MPELVTELYNNVQEGNLEKAWSIYDRLLPLCAFLEGSGKYVQITKRAMELKGWAGGPCRLPRLPLTAEEDAQLKAILADLDVLVTELH